MQTSTDNCNIKEVSKEITLSLLLKVDESQTKHEKPCGIFDQYSWSVS